MMEDKGPDDGPQDDAAPQGKEPILFNWLITCAGLGAIFLVTVLLTQ